MCRGGRGRASQARRSFGASAEHGRSRLGLAEHGQSGSGPRELDSSPSSKPEPSIHVKIQSFGADSGGSSEGSPLRIWGRRLRRRHDAPSRASSVPCLWRSARASRDSGVAELGSASPPHGHAEALRARYSHSARIASSASCGGTRNSGPASACGWRPRAAPGVVKGHAARSRKLPRPRGGGGVRASGVVGIGCGRRPWPSDVASVTCHGSQHCVTWGAHVHPTILQSPFSRTQSIIRMHPETAGPDDDRQAHEVCSVLTHQT